MRDNWLRTESSRNRSRGLEALSDMDAIKTSAEYVLDRANVSFYKRSRA